VATSEHLVGNCILKKVISAALGRSCPISLRDDGARIRSVSRPALCQQWLSWLRGDRGTEGERRVNIWGQWSLARAVLLSSMRPLLCYLVPSLVTPRENRCGMSRYLD